MKKILLTLIALLLFAVLTACANGVENSDGARENTSNGYSDTAAGNAAESETGTEDEVTTAVTTESETTEGEQFGTNGNGGFDLPIDEF